MALKDVMGVFGKSFMFLSSGGMLADILAMAVVAMVLTGIYMKGRYDAHLQDARASTAGVEQNVKDNGKTKRETMGLGESDVDSYLAGWMRD